MKVLKSVLLICFLATILACSSMSGNLVSEGKAATVKVYSGGVLVETYTNIPYVKMHDNGSWWISYTGEKGSWIILKGDIVISD